MAFLLGAMVFDAAFPQIFKTNSKVDHEVLQIFCHQRPKYLNNRIFCSMFDFSFF